MELLVNRIRMIVKPFGPGIDCGGEVAMLAAELAEGKALLMISLATTAVWA